MKARIIEKEMNHGYCGTSHKVKMIGYLKTGEQVTIVFEDDGYAGKSIASQLVGDDIEITLTIHEKKTTITTHQLI